MAGGNKELPKWVQPIGSLQERTTGAQWLIALPVNGSWKGYSSSLFNERLLVRLLPSLLSHFLGSF